MFFHDDVLPLVLYEVANGGIDILSRDFTTHQETFDRLSDAMQAFGSYFVLASEIADLRSRSWVANS